MGRASREKGKRGEREVVALAREHDLEADRTAALQAGGVPGAADVRLRAFPGLHVEVKRDQRLSVDAMVRQAEEEAPEGATPVVAWRRDGMKWRADVPLGHYLALLSATTRRDT